MSTDTKLKIVRLYNELLSAKEITIEEFLVMCLTMKVEEFKPHIE